MPRGGKREGSGRPRLPEELKKKNYTIMLPSLWINWLKDQKLSQARLIENALIIAYGKVKKNK